MNKEVKVTCDTCKKSKQDLCLGKKEICEHYRAIPVISQSERDLWPKFMQGGYAYQSV